jgi:hypothetical protein
MRLALATISACLLLPALAEAGDFLPNQLGDRYVLRPEQGPPVVVEVTRASGAWGHWSNWFGDTWVHSSATSERIFYRHPTTGRAVLIADLDQPVGTSFAVDLPCYRTVTVAAAGGTSITPAGTFTDVAILTFELTCAAGVTSVELARGVGPVGYRTTSLIGSQYFVVEEAVVGGFEHGGHDPAEEPLIRQLAGLSPLFGSWVYRGVAGGHLELRHRHYTHALRMLTAELALAGFHTGRGCDEAYLGPNVVAAVKRFQRAHGRPVTGVVDSGTLIALVVAARGQEEPPPDNGPPPGDNGPPPGDNGPPPSIEDTIFALLPQLAPPDRELSEEATCPRRGPGE